MATRRQQKKAKRLSMTTPLTLTREEVEKIVQGDLKDVVIGGEWILVEKVEAYDEFVSGTYLPLVHFLHEMPSEVWLDNAEQEISVWHRVKA